MSCLDGFYDFYVFYDFYDFNDLPLTVYRLLFDAFLPSFEQIFRLIIMLGEC
jgi:hypothetical protein